VRRNGGGRSGAVTDHSTTFFGTARTHRRPRARSPPCPSAGRAVRASRPDTRRSHDGSEPRGASRRHHALPSFPHSARGTGPRDVRSPSARRYRSRRRHIGQHRPFRYRGIDSVAGADTAEVSFAREPQTVPCCPLRCARTADRDDHVAFTSRPASYAAPTLDLQSTPAPAKTEASEPPAHYFPLCASAVTGPRPRQSPRTSPSSRQKPRSLSRERISRG
jgi:hypothetical protein